MSVHMGRYVHFGIHHWYTFFISHASIKRSSEFQRKKITIRTSVHERNDKISNMTKYDAYFHAIIFFFTCLRERVRGRMSEKFLLPRVSLLQVDICD